MFRREGQSWNNRDFGKMQKNKTEYFHAIGAFCARKLVFDSRKSQTFKFGHKVRPKFIHNNFLVLIINILNQRIKDPPAAKIYRKIWIAVSSQSLAKKTQHTKGFAVFSPTISSKS